MSYTNTGICIDMFYIMCSYYRTVLHLHKALASCPL